MKSEFSGAELVLPSIHDHTLLGYGVSLENSRVTLRTIPVQLSSSEQGLRGEITFEGCVAHHFENAAEGTILGWLLEAPLQKFLSERAVQFETGHRPSGWPTWWRGSVEKAVEFLQERRIHVDEITSSYGLYGWVMAVSVHTSMTI